MRKPAEQETGAVLGGLNYHNPYDLLNLWQGLTWVEDGNYYHTVDGRFWRLYRIQMAPIDTLNDEAMASISAAVTHVFSEFPEGAMGQFLRITHNDMTPIMERYFDDTGKHEPSHQFADTILDSIMRRQIRGAERGFFDRISSAMLQKAKDETLQEAQEVAFKNSLEEAIDDSVQYGRYAQITELYVTLGWEPPWVTAQNKGALAQAVDAILDGIGLRNVDHTSRQAYEASREDFFTAARRLEQAMRRVGFAPRRVTGQGAVELLFRELNPERMLQPLPDVTGATPAPLYRPDLTLREQVFQRPDSGRLGKSDLGDSVFLTPVETHPDGWTIDDTHYMPVSLVGTPENVWPGMLYEVMRDFEGAGWVVMNFSRMRNASARLRVQGRAQVVNLKANLQRFPILEWFTADQKVIENAHADVQTMVGATNPESTEHQAILNASIHVVFKGRDPKTLRERREALSVALWQKGYSETMRGDAIVHSCLPFNIRQSQMDMLGRAEPYRGADLAEFVPVYNASPGSQVSSKVLLNNTSGEPVFVDPFGDDSAAAHALILGGTGSGKSFAVQMILQQMSSKERLKLWVIDKGASFRTFVNRFGGQYIDLALTDDGSDVSFNPFYLPPGDDGLATMPTPDELEYMRSVLISMSQTGSSEQVSASMHKVDLSTFQQVLYTLYRERKQRLDQLAASDPDEHARIIETDQILLSKHIQPMLESKTLAEETEGRSLTLSRMLSDYSLRDGGPYAKFFDRPLSVDWSNDMMGVETDQVSKSEMFSTLMMVLFHNISLYAKYVMPRDVKKIIAMDEAWSGLSDPNIAGIFAGYVYELRKYGCGVWMISQGLGQLISLLEAEQRAGGGVTGGLLENLKHFIFLSCAKSDHDRARQRLNMSDEEILAWDRVSSLPPFFSEFIYRIVNRQDQAITHRIRLYSTPVQLWLSTTDPSDIEMRKERTHALVEQGVERRAAEERALRALAREFPYGSKYVLADDD